MATILRVDGDSEEVQPRNGIDFSLEELQKIVGGYIEIVKVSNRQIMVVDNEGKLKGKPVNLMASFLYGNPDDDAIVGDALVCESGEVK